MKELNKNHVGLLLGGMMALWHLVWSTLVFLGFAKALLDWIFWLHFINIPVTIEPFDLLRAVLLVIVTFIVGYVSGWVAIWLWNALIKRSK
jgi:hypothetical protein